MQKLDNFSQVFDRQDKELVFLYSTDSRVMIGRVTEVHKVPEGLLIAQFSNGGGDLWFLPFDGCAS